MSMEEYREAYMAGYVAGLEKGKAENKNEKPYVTMEDIMERYNCGMTKAGEILRAIRRVCGGGGFGSSIMVKRAELEYWETIVDKTFMANLKATEAK